MAAFWQEKKLWEEQHIESYVFTQTHESNFIKAPATVSFRVAASGCTPVSGNENDMLLCYGGSIALIYSRILSEFEYWRSEMYKNDDYASVDCRISYNAVWHYPESVRFRIGLASGDTVRLESLDIVEFEEVE